jgi:ABC-type sugar transport system ATPase subunit
VLKDGIVQQYGTPAEIYNDPSNRLLPISWDPRR